MVALFWISLLHKILPRRKFEEGRDSAKLVLVCMAKIAISIPVSNLLTRTYMPF